MSRWVSVTVLTTILAFLTTTGGVGSARAAETDAAERNNGYRQEQLTIGEGRKRLAGTLYLPESSAPAPALVVISGSGPNDREGHIGSFRSYGVIAEHLARAGIASLLIDRRGVGGSAGDWRRETIEDRARDALAAVEVLRQRPEIDPARVGLLGHSQGGWVAAEAAAQSDRVAFAVLMAGPGQTVREQILTDARLEMRANGMPAPEAERRVRRLGRLLALADAVAPLCRLLRAHTVCSTIEYDPGPALASIKAPVLALFASLDPMVPPEPNITLIRDGLARAGNDRLTVQVFEGANHQFWPAATGARSEYRRLKPEYVPGFLDTISDWVLTRVGPGRSGSTSLRTDFDSGAAAREGRR